MSLRAFLIRMIWVCVLPLMLLAVYLAGAYVHTLQRQQDREASDRTQDLAVALDRDLSARISALQALTASPLLDDPPRMEEFYREAQGFRESFTGNIILADLSTQMLFNTRVPFGAALPKLPVPKGHAAAPDVIKTGKPSVGDMFLGPIAKETLVAIVVPVVRHGQIKALLLNIIGTAHYQQILDNLALPSGWSVRLVDGKAEVMARRQPRENGPSGNDSPRFFTAGLSASHWSVALEIDGSTYRAPIVDAVTALAAAIMTFTLAGFLGGRLASVRLMRAMETLTRTPPAGRRRSVITEIEAVRTMLKEASMARDVSERSLLESEARFRSLFEAANVGKSVTLPTGEINVNKAFCELLGYEPEELANKTWQELTPAEDIDPINDLLIPLLQGEKDAARFEKRYIHKNGTYIWADVSVAIQRDSYEKPLYFITTVVDITERRQAEEALKRNEQVLRLFVEHSPAAIAMFDREMKYIIASRRYLMDYGLGEQSLVGRSHYEVFPEIPESWKEIHRRCLAGAIEKCAQDPFPRADGSLDWVRWEIHPWFETGGEIGGVILFSEVITERVKAESEIRLRSEQLALLRDITQSALESPNLEEMLQTLTGRLAGLFAADGCYITRWDETRQRTIPLAATGHQRKNYLTTLFFPGDLTITASVLRVGHVLAVEDVMNTPYLSRSVAERFPAKSILALPLIAGEQKMGAAVIEYRRPRSFDDEELAWGEHVARQISLAIARVRLLAELQQYASELEERVAARTAELKIAKERAESADRVKSAFLATMSHELRTPLNSIIGFTGIILQELAGPLNPEQRKQMSMVQNSARHLLALINDVLDISKIEAGQLEVHLSPFDMRQAIEKVVEGLRPAAGKKGLDLRCEIAPGVGLITSDRRRVEQVIINLANNAIKFTNIGEVTIRADLLPAPQSAVRIQVSDTGIGIRAEDISALFEPFHQIDSGLTRTHEGTGLGLSICKRVVEMLGGEIWVESGGEGKGSKFVFRLPLERDIQ